jgi:hypothetical protein
MKSSGSSKFGPLFSFQFLRYCCCLFFFNQVAASLANRSPFLSPAERREAADASKRAFVEDSPTMLASRNCGTHYSDLLAIRNAYRRFSTCGGQQKYDFARERFLSIRTLEAMGQLKRQLLEALCSAGVVQLPFGLQRASQIESAGRRSGGNDGVRLALGYDDSQPSPPEDLMASLIGAALYPQLAYVHAPRSSKSGGACSADNLKLHLKQPAEEPENNSSECCKPQTCFLHPSSVCSKLGGLGWRTPYAAFHEKVKTTRLYARDATPLPPLAPFLLAGSRLKKSSASSFGDLVLDGWLRLRVQPPWAAQKLRKARTKLDARLDRLLRQSSSSSKNNHNNAGASIGEMDDSNLDGLVVSLLSQGPQPEPAELPVSMGNRVLGNNAPSSRKAKGGNKNSKKKKRRAANNQAQQQGNHYAAANNNNIYASWR